MVQHYAVWHDSWSGGGVAGEFIAQVNTEELAASMPDEALVRAAAADPTAFAALYARYHLPVYRYLRLRVTTDEDAADLTQQVFLQAWPALGTYRERGVPFGAWLLRIARNLATNATRRARPTVNLEQVPGLPDWREEHHPERLALQREAIARANLLLDTLHPEQRDLLALRFAAGLSVREIAAVVGVSEAAAKKRLTRLIGTLKERYDAG